MGKHDITRHVPCPETWDEVLAAFEHALYRQGRREPTVRSYSSALRIFAQFYTEQLNKPGPFVPRLQETDLLGFVDYLRRDRLFKATSVNRYIASLRAFAAFVLSKRWHRRDLADELRTYRVEPGPPPPRLSPQEQRRLVGSINLNRRNGPRNRAIVELFLHCGLRVGEVVRLCRDDITLHKTSGRVRVRNDKGYSERTVMLNRTALVALEKYLEGRGAIAGGDPLFVSERRERLSVSAVQQMVKNLLSHIGRDELSVHALRHHFAQCFYERSGKLTATQRVLGHRSITTTVRYARATDEEIDDAIERMAEP